MSRRKKVRFTLSLASLNSSGPVGRQSTPFGDRRYEGTAIICAGVPTWALRELYEEYPEAVLGLMRREAIAVLAFYRVAAAQPFVRALWQVVWQGTLSPGAQAIRQAVAAGCLERMVSASR